MLSTQISRAMLGNTCGFVDLMKRKHSDILPHSSGVRDCANELHWALSIIRKSSKTWDPTPGDLLSFTWFSKNGR